MVYHDKRKLDEIITLIKLEPTLSCIYVEGPTDKRIIEKFICQIGLNNINVYSIDTIDFSQLYPDKPFLIDNNKEKAIELSMQLDKLVDEKSRKIMCVVDKDFDDLLGSFPTNRFLYRTDFTCMEMYTFNIPCLDHFINNVLFGFPIEPEIIISEIGKVLIELFFIRYAISILFTKQMEYDYIDVKKVCVIDKDCGEIQFNKNEYLYRMLNKLEEISRKREYEVLIIDITRKCTSDIRNYIHGHDYIHLLSIYIKRIKNIELKNEDILNRILFLCLDFKELIQYQLFKNIILRFSSATPAC